MTTSKLFKAMVPALFGFAALALAFSVPVAAKAAELGAGAGPQVQGWYDPQGWFERGGPVEHERDWYNYSYDYGRRWEQGFYEPSETQPPYGYYRGQEGQPYSLPPAFYRGGMSRHYYTRDWYDREGAFERWL